MDFQIIKRKLQIQRYSPNTIETYLSCLQKFNAYLNSDKYSLNDDTINKFLLALVKNNFARSTQNQHINAIKFYTEKVLQQKRKIYQIDRPRREKSYL